MYSSYDGNCECEPTSERKVRWLRPCCDLAALREFVNPKTELSSITVIMVLYSGISSCK